MTQKKEAPQHELFRAETAWFHIFKTMIDNGDVAKMGPYAVTVYLVIKSHTNFATGRAFPALETIADKSGVSLAQVKRELKTLAKLGYISTEKRGRSNNYTLREKIEIRDDAGRPSAVATWDYLPASVSAAVADLKNVMMTGDTSGARVVHIERLTVNIANAGGVVLNVNDSKIPADVRAQIEELLRGVKH